MQENNKKISAAALEIPSLAPNISKLASAGSLGIIKFIPGWMDRARFYGYEGPDIWIKNIKPEEKIDADYLVAHSLGNHFALLNWLENKNTKLILVNPLLIKRNFRSWIFRWMRFSLGEGAVVYPQRMYFAHYLFSGIKKAQRFLSLNVLEILDQVSKEDIVCVIRGKKDKYFCTEEVATVIKEKNIPLIELDGVGHMWHYKIDEAIENIISNFSRH